MVAVTGVRPAAGAHVRAGSSFAAAWAAIDRVHGWLAREEAQMLFDAARGVPDGQWIVELGACQGRSTAALALGKRDRVPVLTMDPFDGPEAPDQEDLLGFRETLAAIGAGPEVQLFWGTSDEAAAEQGAVFATARRRAARGADPVFRLGARVHPRLAPPPVGLLFVDACHDRESVLRDIDDWARLVVDGGTVVFHDAFFRRGVTEALLLRFVGRRDFEYIGSVVNASVFRRRRLAPAETLTSSARLAGRLGHFARNAATLVAIRRGWTWLERLFPPRPEFEYRRPDQL